jgi:hypothetical protein
LVLKAAHNETPDRPKLEAISETTRKRLETSNQYDIELYEWVKERFAKQIEPLEPDFSRELRRFEMLNRSFRRICRLTPPPNSCDDEAPDVTTAENAELKNLVGKIVSHTHNHCDKRAVVASKPATGPDST